MSAARWTAGSSHQAPLAAVWWERPYLGRDHAASTFAPSYDDESRRRRAARGPREVLASSGCLRAQAKPMLPGSSSRDKPSASQSVDRVYNALNSSGLSSIALSANVTETANRSQLPSRASWDWVTMLKMSDKKNGGSPPREGTASAVR